MSRITTSFILIIIVTLLSLAGCSPKPIIKVDLDTYLRNPDQYKDQQVVIATTLKDVTERFDLYRGKVVELSAPVTYYGFGGFWTWHIILEKDGEKLRCYEYKYRLYPDPTAVNLALSAKTQEGEVTVQGELLRDGIELNRLKYKSFNINTNLDFYKYRYAPTGRYW
jgi:hypothetical protein